MDLNITTFENNHQENQLLLNAIKNKFDAQSATEAAAFSPPKLNIPQLKISENINPNNISSNTQTIHSSGPTTQLNQYLFKQLQKQQTSNGLCKKPAGLVVPKLQYSTDNNIAVKFEWPNLKPLTANANIGSLTTAINNLQVQDNSCDTEKYLIPLRTPAIDLTTALANKVDVHQGTPPTRDLIKIQQSSDKLDFEVPFIDCDRLETSRTHKMHLPISNEYCVTDISQLLLRHSLARPSVVGRFLCIDDNKYLAPLPLKCLAPEYRLQKVKHNIEPFRFETKSPDDLVLSALNKYQKRYYN